jgi:hypothetical protein
MGNVFLKSHWTTAYTTEQYLSQSYTYNLVFVPSTRVRDSLLHNAVEAMAVP